jgi:hypothetical protein
MQRLSSRLDAYAMSEGAADEESQGAENDEAERGGHAPS